MDFYSKIIERLNQNNPYSMHSNIFVTRVEHDYAEGELEVVPESLNPMGVVHGGCLSTLADTVGGAAVISRGRRCVTLTATLNYLRPGSGKKLTCKASVRKSGSTIAVCDLSVTDDVGREVASGCYTYYMKEPLLPEEL
ncbi:MAG: PaaI family thioesterase [Oscillospiraceae bacterium]|nr:PaaI family thioesterase [Oscillospiraceae bacterium]